MSEPHPITGLHPLNRDEALALTRGEYHDFIREHPGQSYLVERRQMSTLAEHIANGIKNYAGGESEAYSYHGDGSALEAMRELDKNAISLAGYIIDNMESLLDAMDDAIDDAMSKHEPCDNDSVCTCGARNNMDGDVLYSHRFGLVCDAVRTSLGLT